MIKQCIQNLSGPRYCVCSECEESHYLPVDGDWGCLAGAVRALRDYVAASFRRQARVAEDRRAIEHLQSLSDAQLRDMGITRMDISHAVKFGKQDR